MIKLKPKYLQLNYIDNSIEQTLLWINGVSKHFNDECCIDFSCCFPELLMSYERRLKVGTQHLDNLHDRREDAKCKDEI